MNQPRPPSDIANILADCLDAIDRGEKTLAQCLDDYPQHAVELRAEIMAAMLTRKLKSPALSEASVDRIAGKLFNSSSVIPLDEEILPPRRPPPRTQSAILSMGLARMAASLLIVFLVVVGGTIAVSANSQPGDALYSVKRFWEDIILALSPLTGSKSDLALHFARVRLEETERLASGNNLTDTALVDLYQAVSREIILTNGDMTILIPVLDDAHQRLKAIAPPTDLEALHQDLLNATIPNIQNGIVQPLRTTLPPHLSSQSDAIPQASATPIPTLTPTSESGKTPLPTFTPTNTWTPSPTASPTLTGTPRIPPTPTRTPSPTPSPTLTLTPLPTLTLTWTPLPLPGTLVVVTLPPTLPPGLIPTETPYNLPTAQFTPRERETQQSVHMTQTAQASP